MSMQSLTCASCGAAVSQNDAFCENCGKPLGARATAGTPSRARIPDIAPEPDAQQKMAVKDEPVTVYVKPEIPLAFASGLPEWSIEPPVVAVRRKARI